MIKELAINNFSLVLSGGGALGISHLGVLHDLETYNLIPSEIIGTSMGGIIGACIAIGLKEKEIYSILQDFSSVSKWISFSFSGNAIVNNHRIEEIFEDIFKDRMMNDVSISLKIIATDLENGEKRVFDAQDNVMIKDALLATMAIPGIFTEHIIQGKTYVDGFLSENLGINEASFQYILAIDVLGKNAYDNELPDNFFKTANILEMFEKSMRLLIYNQTKTHLAHLDKHIYLIEPHTKDYKTFHFHKIDEIRALGMGLLKDIHVP